MCLYLPLCVCVCEQEDLSEPLYEEDLDGSAGVLFPFYDPDTHMLYLAGKVAKRTHAHKKHTKHSNYWCTLKLPPRSRRGQRSFCV